MLETGRLPWHGDHHGLARWRTWVWTHRPRGGSANSLHRIGGAIRRRHRRVARTLEETAARNAADRPRPHRSSDRLVAGLAAHTSSGKRQAPVDRLLCNGRKGRKGFPIAVHDELVALQNWTQMFYSTLLSRS